MAGAGSGQDPGADPPDRLADLRAQGPPRLDPGDHLHQQGRRRDEGAGRGPGRPAGPDHVGLDVPLRLRADPAQGDRASFGLQVELLDLRRRRLQAADDAGLPRTSTSTRSATSRGAVLNWVSNQKNELRDPEEAAGGHPQQRSRRRTPRPTRSTSSGCATANALDFDDLIMTTVAPVPGVPRGARDLPAPVPARARRRVPGHQPRAVRPDPPALRRRRRGARLGGDPAAERRRAGRADGGRRRRPVDLRLPRRQHPQHPRLRAGLPQRHLDPAGAELPLHPDHPHRRQRGDRPQQGPQGEEPLVRRRRRRADRRLRRRRRARRGAVRLRGDRQARPTTGGARPRDVAVFYRTNAQSRVFEEVFIRTGQPYKVVGGVRFYERREVRDALAYLRMLVNPADEVSLRRILNVPKRGIGDRAECLRRRRTPQRERITFWEALRRADEAPGHRDPVADGDPGLRRAWSRSSSRWSTRGSGPTSCSSRCWRARGYLDELEASDDPQDETRVGEPRRARRGRPRVLRRPRRRARPPTRPTSTPAP